MTPLTSDSFTREAPDIEVEVVERTAEVKMFQEELDMGLIIWPAGTRLDLGEVDDDLALVFDLGGF